MGWTGEEIRALNDKRRAPPPRRIGRAVGIAGAVLFLAVAFFLRLVEPESTGPFGLSMGMKPSDVGGILEKLQRPGMYQTTKVPTPHSSFVRYGLLFGPKNGLGAILASTKNVETSAYDSELRRDFDNLEERLKVQYGKYEKLDYLQKGSIWNEPEDFMYALLEKERRLEAHWVTEVGSMLRDNIQEVLIRVRPHSSESGYTLLRYRFENFRECQKELKDLDVAEDEIL